MPRNDNYREYEIALQNEITTSTFTTNATWLDESSSIDPVPISTQFVRKPFYLGFKRAIFNFDLLADLYVSDFESLHIPKQMLKIKYTQYQQDSCQSYIGKVKKLILSLSNGRLHVFILLDDNKFYDISFALGLINKIMHTWSSIYEVNGKPFISQSYAYQTTGSASYYYQEINNYGVPNCLNLAVEKLYESALLMGWELPDPANTHVNTKFDLLRAPLMRNIYKPWLLGIGAVISPIDLSPLLYKKNLKTELKKIFGRDNPEFLRIFFKYLRIDRLEKRKYETPAVQQLQNTYTVIFHSLGHKHLLEKNDLEEIWVYNTNLNLERFLTLIAASKIFKSLDYQHKFLEKWVSEQDSACNIPEEVCEFLSKMPDHKIWRLLAEPEGPGLQRVNTTLHISNLQDTLEQVKEYNAPESIPELLKQKYPNGLEIPKKWHTIKELHDVISKQYNEIKMEADNKPIKYPETWLKLDNQMTADLTFPDSALTPLTIKLAHETKKVVEWGYLLQHCIANYADRAMNGIYILVGLYNSDELVYNARIDPKTFEIIELRGLNNATDETSKRYEYALKNTILSIHEMKEPPISYSSTYNIDNNNAIINIG